MIALLSFGLALAQNHTTGGVVPTMAERQAAFGEVNEFYKAGKKRQAADQLVAVATDDALTHFHAEAYARLGAILAELELPYAALVAYQQALEANPAAVASEVKQIIALAEQVGDTALLEPLFAANVGLDVDAATRSKMALLAARGAHRSGSYATALAILKLVDSKDAVYGDAKALEGVVLSMQDRHQDALAPLLIAEGLLGQGSDADAARRLVVVQLNLARAYYGADNYSRAIEYFQKVPRDSEYWIEAQFERAWAHFRMNDMNGALSLLHTHQNPYLDEAYFPEAELLRVYALFMMCKFPEANTQIEAFQQQYASILTELEGLQSKGAQALFDDLRGETNGTISALPPMVKRPFLTEARFPDRLNAIESAETEMGRLQNVSDNPFSQTAMNWVDARRGNLMAEEGQRVQERVKKMAGMLNEMLNNVEISKLDIMQMETRLYERAAATGAFPDVPRKVSRKLRLRKGSLYWPWQGEYWADEVGYVRIDTKPDCPDALKVGE